MSQWNLHSTTPPVVLSISAGDGGAITGTLTCGPTSYSVTGAWAASGSVPGRNASAFSIAGASSAAATRFAAANGIMIGSGSAPTSINLQVAEASSADGSLTAYAAVLLP